MSRPDAKVSSALRPLGKLIGCKVSAADGKLVPLPLTEFRVDDHATRLC